MQTHTVFNFGILWRILAIVSSFSIAVTGCSLMPPSPVAVVDPFVLSKRLGRGVNLGNALEAPIEGEWGVVLTEEYFQIIKDGGFDSVRIPIRWSAHAGQSAPYTIDPRFFERIDWAIAQARKQGLLAVLDFHGYDEMMAQPEEHRPRFVALWEQIALRYRDQPAEVVFELLNEPNGALNGERWNDILADTLRVVRRTNPTRCVIIGPIEWYSIPALDRLELPTDDRYLIASVHYYNPFRFTHQGAEWVAGSEPWLGTTWLGTESEKVAVRRELDRAARWAQDHERPLYLGEFGAYGKADMGSRARWTAYIAREAEARQMSWAYWEFGAGFGVYDRAQKRWNAELLRALMGE
jgi:endoglucanase